MSSQSDAVREQPETHKWRGDLQDFIDLKPEEHTYESVLQHTENLLCKLRRDDSNVDAMVSQGVIRPLVVVLDHEDRRNYAKLQYTAVKALRLIVDKASKADLVSAIIAADGISPLLSLLSLRLDEVAIDVLQVLDKLVGDEDIHLVSSVPGCIGALIEATHCKTSTVKHASLNLIEFVLSEIKLPAEKVPDFLGALFPLLDADVWTVLLTCQLFNAVAGDRDILVVEAMVSTGVLPHFVALLQKFGTDPTLIKIAEQVLFCARALACRSKDFYKEIMQKEFLRLLSPYLECSRPTNVTCIHASWLLAYVIYHHHHHHHHIVDMLVEMQLIPYVEVLYRVNSSHEETVLSAVLSRLLRNTKYLQKYLKSHFLSYLVSLQHSSKWRMLHRLLIIFKDSLAKAQEQGKLAEVKDAIFNCGFMEDLSNMQYCGDPAVQSVSEEVVAMCLK